MPKASTFAQNLSGPAHCLIHKQLKVGLVETSPSYPQAKQSTIKLGSNLTIVEVPYSEHSSFDELCQCVRDLQPKKIVATVDGGWKGDRHAGMAALRENL